ncbi:retrotransposon protein, putative, ty1-copia subclass [Tanacetum coccineum]
MVRSMISQTTLPKSFWDYSLESAACILNMVPTKKGCEALVKRDTLTKPNKLEPRSFKWGCEPLVARNAEFFESNLIDQEASGSLEDLEIIQEEDTNPSLDTSLNYEEDDQEIDEPQSDINPICRSRRTRHLRDRLCLHIDAKEHELGDLNNAVWELVELPPYAKTVGNKWLFKKKTDMDGVVHTFKSRLVAKGFTQTYGVGYEETFFPVAYIRAIRILIAIATFYDYEIWQMDVKTAFLNGHLFEEVYMTQPKGFVNPKYPNHVCKLKRSIYGLKQDSRQWNKQFDDEIKKFCFTQNRNELCVYQKASGSYVTFLILYVDDILIMGNNIRILQDVKSYLGKCFAMKDLGEAAYILGIKIYRDRSRRLIGLCQSAYIKKILKRYYIENSKRGTIQMQDKLKLSKSDGASTPAEMQRMSNVPFASATTVKNILKYLRNTKDMFLVYGGYVFVLNGGVRKSTKQSIFATSSIDAEYITAFDASKEAVWIRKFISGLNVFPIIEEPITMYYNNTGAITIANDHGVTKDDNRDDPFTKALAFPKHSELTRKIGLVPASGLM